jgi:hypothetical protein
MPQQRVIVTIEKSPQQRINLGTFDKAVAQNIKRALDPAKGGKVVDVQTEDI